MCHIMFKIESYITPILLSYVDRYIKNFRLEDSQLSLWGGDASFHNLDLRLEVLEQELQLPFSFVSGHIRELLIHVPWTKLASEPITVTINTIECILKLRGPEPTTGTESAAQTREKSKRTAKQEVEAPPSYIQLLINKIVSNIRICCNNVILKYVEEDIVLSMNVKLLKFESANEKWESSYTDLSSGQVILRKIISVNDLTLCLDKRNAAGKIDVYQEPMLYRCSMVMHLLRHYHSATANRASTTRLDIYCNNMEFGMTEQQVPMLMRLIMLLYALQQKQLKPEPEIPTDSSNIPSEFRENHDGQESWTGWAWSYVSSVLPAPWDEEWNMEQLKNQSGHTVHIGFYLDNLSITFKVSESSCDRGYYSHKKLRYWPLLKLQLQGIYSESIMHGLRWFNSSFGISQAILLPVGFCSCSHDENNATPYLSLGSVSNAHKTDSLFDAEATENKGNRREYNTSWDYHLSVNSESVLLERTPAVAFDYVYQMEIPNDATSDILSDLGSDNEYSNISEISNLRMCFGPFRLNLCSGLFHRISSLRVAAAQYDYPPYSTPKPDQPLNELLPPSEEDFDALSDFISNRTIRITFFAPLIELQLLDHPFFVATKGHLFRKRKKASTSGPQNAQKCDIPKITVECQFLDISFKFPMYVNRLVHTTCQLPEPPQQLFAACYSQQSIKILRLSGKLILNPHTQTTILTPCTISYTSKSILKPQYWIKTDIPHREVTFESECVTINGTKAKIMVVSYIIEKIFRMECDIANSIQNSSLIFDACKDYGLPYLEFCIEGIRFRQVTTNSTVSVDVSLGSIKSFISEPVDVKMKNSKDIQQILFLSGPEPSKDKNICASEDLPLFTATMQYPLDPNIQTHPPILVFNLQEIRICIDPLLCRWLLYKPSNLFNKNNVFFDSVYSKSKSLSEASGSAVETPRRLSSQLESVHSSSDRDVFFYPQKATILTKETGIDLQEKIYNLLKTWFNVWKGMLLCGDISQCTIYFPMMSLSAVGSQGIQEAVEAAIHNEKSPEIMVITLPFANIRSAQRQSVMKYLKTLPVTLSSSFWSLDKSSFPWTMSISELSCYTIQCGAKLIFLKPVSLSATVGLSTRLTISDSTISSEDISQIDSKTDIGYLGVCVHIDMTPVVISTSEVQIYLFASILYGVMEVASNLLPEKLNKNVTKTADALPAIITKSNSTISPNIIREDSASEYTPSLSNVNTDNIVTETVKLTAWVQWTITRFTIELLSNEVTNNSDSEMLRLKLVVDAEDIVSSLDFQSVYLKLKSKIGSVSIHHYKRADLNEKWNPGPFSGIVMRLREDLGHGQTHEDNGFFSITITRASCKHTHTLWGAVQKMHKEKKASNPSDFLSPYRYITEIVITVQPIDFILSPKTLNSFYKLLLPLLDIPLDKGKTKNENFLSKGFNNQILPLAYLECQDIRFVLPSSELSGHHNSLLHDVYMFQVRKICLGPTAVNPICRIPLRSDIYEQAGHARILNVPGSEVEDRQYQLDIIGLSVSTGAWIDLESLFSQNAELASNLRVMSENPALEWNNLEKGQPNMAPTLNLWQVVQKFDISIVVAPAMVYKDTTIICGNSIEVNFVTDIAMNLSLSQIKLASSLSTEFVMLFQQLLNTEGQKSNSKLKFPYAWLEGNQARDEDNDLEVIRDSGIETSEIRSLSSKTKTHNASKGLSDSEPHSNSFVKLSLYSVQDNFIPVEVLFTAGGISLSLYQIDDLSKPQYCKTKSKKKKAKIVEDEEGYEASEESVEEKFDHHNNYVPLLYVSFIQPNAFFANQFHTKLTKISCFDVKLNVTDSEYVAINHIPTTDDYSVKLLETRSGIPNLNTGILPTFFTLQYLNGLNKNANVDLEVSKPCKVLCSTDKWIYLLGVKDKLCDTFKCNEVQTETSTKPKVMVKYNDSYTKFQEIKDRLGGISTITLKCDQIIFALKSQNRNELHFGVKKINSGFSIFTRPEKINNHCKFECMTLTVTNENFRRLLLNPWTISIDCCLFWEAWQSSDSNPQMHITVESDCIMLDLNPDQLKCIEVVLKDLAEFFTKLPKQQQTEPAKPEPRRLKSLDKDQHYKDDLRAGAFQFIDSCSNNISELPMPYQVMFWNGTTSAMAWRYPQPRSLTKVRVFPVPYKITLGSSDTDLQVLCQLEYWSDCRNCYQPFTKFYLSESEVSHLVLPDYSAKKIVASTWRVVITMINKQVDLDESFHGISISPRALAACMRIDSYFNKSLIPSLTASLYSSKIEVNLFNHISKTSTKLNLPKELKHFSPDFLFPESQSFLRLSFDNLTAHALCWNFNTITSELSTSTKCSVLDYAFLTNQSLIEPFTWKLETILDNSLTCNLISQPINLIFGPSIAHTLAVSAQLWNNSDAEQDFIITTRYVICNDTNVNIRVGQSSTDEDILLLPKYFHLYAWRSQKRRQLLRIALEMNEWIWSKAFEIQEDGLQTIYLRSERNLTVLITVKSLSVTQKKITISGQLIVSNLLLEHFELKVVEAVKENKDVAFKAASTYISAGKSSTSSILIDIKRTYFLRLRFYGLESAWTGDIPLREHANGSQPWLVKVPLQERGQFLSIWCRIVIQDVNQSKRYLAMLWPLFAIRSNLPINTNVQIETPLLNVNLEVSVKGKGEIQQLYCPGTIDHSHQLSFKFENGNSPSNPYVPLNYSLVDQQKFFRRPDKEDIDNILEVLNTYCETKWPYFEDDSEVEWLIEEQPLTHVQVKYQNACQYSSSLLIELLPWSLMVNTLGISISVVHNGVELCRLQHHGIVAPPKLETIFNIGVGIDDAWYYSGPLQLVKSDWSQAFYMPKITGAIPLDGTIKTAVVCESHVTMVSLTSSMVNDIRLLKVASTHILNNYMKMQIQVVCIAVPECDNTYEFPTNLDSFSFVLPPQLEKCHSGLPIIKWLKLDKEDPNQSEFVLYIAFSVDPKLGWSCPIRVDKPILRKSFAVNTNMQSVPIVLTSQEYKGQIYLSIHYDTRPQVFVENNSNISLFCAQSIDDSNNVVLSEALHLKWVFNIASMTSSYYSMPSYSEKFPELPQNYLPEKIAIAADPESDLNEMQWSAAVNLTSDNQQYLRIPYYGDLKLTIVNTACTIILTIDSVNQVEISAKDIRVRLSRHEIEKSLPKNNIKKILPVSEPSAGCKIKSMAYKHERKSLQTATISLKPNWDYIKISVFLKSFVVTLTSDLKSMERCDLANLVCDNIALSAYQSESFIVKLSASDIQFDNQLYSRESYDFPVVLIGQKQRVNKIMNSLSVPIDELITSAYEDALLVFEMTFDTMRDSARGKTITGAKNVRITLNPISAFIEDIYIARLMDYLNNFIPTRLVLWPNTSPNRISLRAGSVYVPELVSWQCIMLARPLTIRNIIISPISLLLSIHGSVKLYIALDQSPLVFGRFERRRLLTTSYRLGHTLSMHYLSGAILGAGWVVSSLELLGSPGGLARAMGTGLRDFVSMPYRGLVLGPMAFLRGITHGSASLMRHVTAGTLQSVTKLASSVARNLDRLTLDDEHLRRTEEQRRQRPQGVAQGFMQGLTGLGISLLGAVGGVAHHPLQSLMADGASPRSLAAGVGLGLVGVFTKPLSGAAELVALTGQGLLQGAGWNLLPEPRSAPLVHHNFSTHNLALKYNWKLSQSLAHLNLLYVVDATSISSSCQYEAVALLLTLEGLVIFNIDEDVTEKLVSLRELTILNNNDPTLLSFKLTPALVPPIKLEDECMVEMDPACRARVADYVRSTVGLLNLPENNSPDHSDISISPLSSPGISTNAVEETTILSFYVNPQDRNYFLCLLSLAKQQYHIYNFPVL